MSFSPIFGIAMGGIVAYAFVPIAVAIGISVIVGAGLDSLDDRYHLSEKLTAVLEDLGNQIAKAADNKIYDAKRTLYQGFWYYLRSGGLKGNIYK